MMKPCEKCLENNWKYKYNDGWAMAICQNCGHYVEWNAKKNKVKLASGQICPGCENGTLIKKISKFKPSKLKKPYYFIAYYYCPSCKRKFMAEEFKIINIWGMGMELEKETV